MHIGKACAAETVRQMQMIVPPAPCVVDGFERRRSGDKDGRDFYSTFDSKNYIYPRRDLCVLGGSFDIDAWDITPDDTLTKTIIEWACTLEPKLKGAEIIDVRVGLRPLRSTVRLEKEILPSNRTVIHNYGHGGCGYTLAWGCAGDVLAMVAS